MKYLTYSLTFLQVTLSSLYAQSFIHLTNTSGEQISLLIFQDKQWKGSCAQRFYFQLKGAGFIVRTGSTSGWSDADTSFEKTRASYLEALANFKDRGGIVKEKELQKRFGSFTALGYSGSRQNIAREEYRFFTGKGYRYLILEAPKSKLSSLDSLWGDVVKSYTFRPQAAALTVEHQLWELGFQAPAKDWKLQLKRGIIYFNNDQSKIEVRITRNPSGKSSAAELLKSLKQKLQSAKAGKVRLRKKIKLLGREAHSIKFSLSEPAFENEWIFFEKSGQLYLISISGPSAAEDAKKQAREVFLKSLKEL